MSARYQVLQHEKKPYWLTNCPLLMVTHALTKDTLNNTIFLQCKFQNLNDKKIKAFNIHIECFDVTGQPLTAVFLIWISALHLIKPLVTKRLSPCPIAKLVHFTSFRERLYSMTMLFGRMPIINRLYLPSMSRNVFPL